MENKLLHHQKWLCDYSLLRASLKIVTQSLSIEIDWSVDYLDLPMLTDHNRDIFSRSNHPLSFVRCCDAISMERAFSSSTLWPRLKCRRRWENSVAIELAAKREEKWKKCFFKSSQAYSYKRNLLLSILLDLCRRMAIVQTPSQREHNPSPKHPT